MTKPKLAIIQFPGSNCEYETLKAVNYYGFEAKIIRWNCSSKEFFNFNAYILPGGFSYQDRVRAGVISSKLPIMNFLKQVALEKKPVLGICNGCQILAETGLIADLKEDQNLSVALAPNTKNNKPVGFICDWIFVKAQNPEKSLFTKYFSEADILPIPINHGEGKFILSLAVQKTLNNLASFTYCSFDGQAQDYPVTPNGSYQGLAGLTNKNGNVLAIMPHPERAALLKQIPFWIKSSWSAEKKIEFNHQKDGDGPWAKLFLALYDYVKK